MSGDLKKDPRTRGSPRTLQEGNIMRTWYVEVRHVETILATLRSGPNSLGSAYILLSSSIRCGFYIASYHLQSCLLRNLIDRAQTLQVHYKYSSIRAPTATAYTMLLPRVIGFSKNKKELPPRHLLSISYIDLGQASTCRRDPF